MYCETVFSDTKSCLILQFPSHIVLYVESLSVSKRNFQKPFLFIDIIFYFVMEMYIVSFFDSLFHHQNVIVSVIIIFIFMYGERAFKGNLYLTIKYACMYVAGMHVCMLSIAFVTGTSTYEPCLSLASFSSVRSQTLALS